MKLSLKPIRKILYEEFQNNLTKEAEMINDVQKSNALKNIYQVFENELNRKLSPLEISLVGEWVDNGLSDETSIAALREALAKGRKTLKSVDRILLQWQAKDDIEKTGGYTTISERWNKDIDKTITTFMNSEKGDEECTPLQEAIEYKRGLIEGITSNK